MGTVAVEGLGKAFRQYPSRWARLAEWLDPRGRPRHALHWVLRGVNFAVAPGEAVGLVGVNGAGKSTLLKIVTGTMAPTEGRVRVAGRVAALLELGLGFHPEFSGRQNAVLAGQLLGIPSGTMQGLLPGIEEFAEIGAYFDEPVRVYSSGMQMRLAFAVATAIRPDVLIVDEALSVGDAYFQHKCFARIREFRAAGTTLLFVSHDPAAIVQLCDRAVLLDGGRVAQEGSPEAVLDAYNALIARREAATLRQQALPDGGVRTESGSGRVRLVGVRLCNEAGEEIALARVGDAVRLCVRLRAQEAVDALTVGFMLRDRVGATVFGTNTFHLGVPLGPLAAGQEREVVFSFPVNLGPGSYAVTLAAHGGAAHVEENFHWVDRMMVFEVTNVDRPPFVGTAWLPVRAQVR